MMKNCFVLLFIGASVIAGLSSCKEKKAAPTEQQEMKVEAVKDTAYYGTCGEGTSMHSLELVTEDGKTLTFMATEEDGSQIMGGMLNGDKMTVTAHETADGLVADKIVNLTTLLGHWTSLDRNFDLKEDGSIQSDVQAETKPYTAWSAVNGNIVLNNDTFSVAQLGPDSLSLENDKGIFVYKRQH